MVIYLDKIKVRHLLRSDQRANGIWKWEVSCLDHQAVSRQPVTMALGYALGTAVPYWQQPRQWLAPSQDATPGVFCFVSCSPKSRT